MCFCTSELRRSIKSGNIETVKQLLESAGESAPDYINEDYTSDCLFDCFRRNTLTSPLHTALNRQRLDIAWLLLDYGAEVNSRGFWYQTPLHLACRQNNLTMAKTLIEKYKADFKVQDDSGNYPIHSACLTRDTKFFASMCSEGYFSPSDLMLRDYSGNTVLHTAALRNNDVLILHLVNMGADLEAKNNSDQKPIDMSKPLARVILQQLIQYK